MIELHIIIASLSFTLVCCMAATFHLSKKYRENAHELVECRQKVAMLEGELKAAIEDEEDSEEWEEDEDEDSEWTGSDSWEDDEDDEECEDEDEEDSEWSDSDVIGVTEADADDGEDDEADDVRAAEESEWHDEKWLEYARGTVAVASIGPDAGCTYDNSQGEAILAAGGEEGSSISIAVDSEPAPVLPGWRL